MPIKINGQTSGSVTLSAPDTGSDVTLSLPGSNLDLAAIPQANISNLTTDLASKLPIAGGKILQIVRATDSTQRSTTSTSYVDVTGMSVTITPQKNNSAIIIAAIFSGEVSSALDATNLAGYQITDASNNSLSGAADFRIGSQNVTGTSNRAVQASCNLWGYSTPATVSAVTYKLRFRVFAANYTNLVRNDQTVGQLYAIEVSA